MKQRNRARSSSLFLLELIFAIFFFSIASAVCVKIFAASHSMSNDAQNLNWAVGECSGIAEIICTSDSEDAAVSTITNVYGKSNKDALEIRYDSNYKPCELRDSDYSIKIDISTDNNMLKADITAYAKDSDDAIYELHPEHYIG